ncbi:MAG: hypothetical protein H7259_07920 [Cytophagales bacterium]|nr:hypothetical protein [Cytophaga sp.]
MKKTNTLSIMVIVSMLAVGFTNCKHYKNVDPYPEAPYSPPVTATIPVIDTVDGWDWQQDSIANWNHQQDSLHQVFEQDSISRWNHYQDSIAFERRQQDSLNK